MQTLIETVIGFVPELFPMLASLVLCSCYSMSLSLFIGGLSPSPEITFDNTCGNTVFNPLTSKLIFTKTNKLGSD